jgi:hypothetical protein
MKFFLLGTTLLANLVTPAAFGVEFNNIPISKAWGIACTMVDSKGRGLTDYQVTTFSMNKKPLLMIKYIDGSLGDNWANVALTSVETAEGGGNDLVEYTGDIVKGATGDMLEGSKELSIIVDFKSPLHGTPNTFKSRMLLDKKKNPNFPAWAKARELYCTLVPQA